MPPDIDFQCFQHAKTPLNRSGAGSETQKDGAHLAMMSGKASLMLAGKALRFLGSPIRPGGSDTDSPCSSTLLALPMVAFTPVLASPNPVLAMALTQFCTQREPP